MELADFEADAAPVVEVEEADDAGLFWEPEPKSPKIVARSAKILFRSLPKLDVPELPPLADVAIPEPPVGAELGGTPAGPPWLPCPPACCWTSLKSVCTSLSKVWKSLPSDELLKLDDDPLVADESVPLFDALVEFASPPEADELISRTSISNAVLPLGGEPLLAAVGPVLVGVVPALLLRENAN